MAHATQIRLSSRQCNSLAIGDPSVEWYSAPTITPFTTFVIQDCRHVPAAGRLFGWRKTISVSA